MKVIPFSYLKSKPVDKLSTIQNSIVELKKFILNKDVHVGAYAIHHMQVSDNPFNFFIVEASLTIGPNAIFKSQVIINPEIIEIDTDLIAEQEGCLSFPYRKPRRVKRGVLALVCYQYLDDQGKLITIKRELVRDLQSCIFQHECEHAEGKNIYFDGHK